MAGELTDHLPTHKAHVTTRRVDHPTRDGAEHLQSSIDWDGTDKHKPSRTFWPLTGPKTLHQDLPADERDQAARKLHREAVSEVTSGRLAPKERGA